MFLERAPADALYIVVKGRLRIERLSEDGDSQVLAFRKAGESVGEMGVIDGLERSAQVTAASACHLLVLPRAEFVRCLLSNPGVSLEIMKTMAARLREAAQAAIDRRSKDIHERLLGLIENRADAEGNFRMEMSQNALADVLGCTREAVNRGYRTLEQTGKIRRIGPRAGKLLAPGPTRDK